MATMTGKRGLMEMLRAEGVKYIFGNPGTSEGPILDALEESGQAENTIVDADLVDGQLLARLEPDDRVRVERASESFQLIEVGGHDDYDTLREKLDWGGRIRQKR